MTTETQANPAVPFWQAVHAVAVRDGMQSPIIVTVLTDAAGTHEAAITALLARYRQAQPIITDANDTTAAWIAAMPFATVADYLHTYKELAHLEPPAPGTVLIVALQNGVAMMRRYDASPALQIEIN